MVLQNTFLQIMLKKHFCTHANAFLVTLILNAEKYTDRRILSLNNVQMDIAAMLLEYGASAEVESKAGFTPLHLSAQEGHADMTNLLLEHKSNVNHSSKVCYFAITNDQFFNYLLINLLFYL